MLFLDHEAESKYRLAPMLLQVVCQILEGNLAVWMYQLEIIDIENQGNIWVALAVTGRDGSKMRKSQVDILEGSAGYVNSMFRRTDQRPTVVVEDPGNGLLTVLISKSADFSSHL